MLLKRYKIIFSFFLLTAGALYSDDLQWTRPYKPPRPAIEADKRNSLSSSLLELPNGIFNIAYERYLDSNLSVFTSVNLGFSSIFSFGFKELYNSATYDFTAIQLGLGLAYITSQRYWAKGLRISGELVVGYDNIVGSSNFREISSGIYLAIGYQFRWGHFAITPHLNLGFIVIVGLTAIDSSHNFYSRYNRTSLLIPPNIPGANSNFVLATGADVILLFTQGVGVRVSYLF